MQAGLYCLYLGGGLHLGWALFHLGFPRIFKWSQALSDLDPVNRRIYRILNICLTFYFLAAAYLSIAFAPELLASPLGHKLIAVFTAFWLMRLGLQLRFFPVFYPVSALLSLLFLLTMGAYGYPLLTTGG